MSHLFTAGIFLLAHFKLVLIVFFFVMRIVSANAKKAKEREAKLRGNTGISDFSTPAPLAPPSSKPTAPPAFSPPRPASTSKAPPASPWASEQNPFDNKKS